MKFEITYIDVLKFMIERQEQVMTYVVMWNSENNLNMRIPKGPSAIRVTAESREEAVELCTIVLLERIVEDFDYMSCSVSNATGEYVIEIHNELEPDFVGFIKDFVAMESFE